MDFYSIVEEYPFVGTSETLNPFAGKTPDGDWIKGTISLDFLNTNFGKFNTVSEMKEATTSEGLKLFFDYLVEQGHLQP